MAADEEKYDNLEADTLSASSIAPLFENALTGGTHSVAPQLGSTQPVVCRLTSPALPARKVKHGGRAEGGAPRVYAWGVVGTPCLEVTEAGEVTVSVVGRGTAARAYAS